MIVEDIDRDATILEGSFNEVANMSGLELTIPTIVFPLHDGAFHMKEYMEQNITSGWKHVQINGVGTYLGFKMGP